MTSVPDCGVSFFRFTSQSLIVRLFATIGLALLLTPVAGVSFAQTVSAQSARQHVQIQRRGVVRRRVRRQKTAKKSFFGSLFGSKPVARRAPTRGVRPLFSSFGDSAQRGRSPAGLKRIYEKKMRAAARRDGLRGPLRIKPGLRKKHVKPAFARRAIRGWSAGQGKGKGKGKGQYRTMCVRMCDGYYFPIRFSARARHFKMDEQRCNANCSNAPTQLFYYPNGSKSVQNMRSLAGVRYKNIANAFKYRKKFVADCRCQAEPWSAQAKQKHENWAALEKQKNRPVKEAKTLKEGGQGKSAQLRKLQVEPVSLRFQDQNFIR